MWVPKSQLSDFRLSYSSPLVLTTNTFLQADSASQTGGGSWDATMGHPFPNGGYYMSGYRLVLQSGTTNNTTSSITIQLRRVPANFTATSSVGAASGTLVHQAVIPITTNTGGVTRFYYTIGNSITPIIIPEDQMVFAVVTSQNAQELKGCIFHIAVSRG
jgi:hypothetical protein